MSARTVTIDVEPHEGGFRATSGDATAHGATKSDAVRDLRIAVADGGVPPFAVAFVVNEREQSDG